MALKWKKQKEGEDNCITQTKGDQKFAKRTGKKSGEKKVLRPHWESRM